MTWFILQCPVYVFRIGNTSIEKHKDFGVAIYQENYIFLHLVEFKIPQSLMNCLKELGFFLFVEKFQIPKKLTVAPLCKIWQILVSL